MPVIAWNSNLTNVDISDQDLHTDAELAYSTLNLTNVNSRYCGVYTCSVMDNFTSLPSTGNTTVTVNTGTIAQPSLHIPAGATHSVAH